MALRLIAAEQIDGGAQRESARPTDSRGHGRGPSAGFPVAESFLRIPPFPGAQGLRFERLSAPAYAAGEASADLIELIKLHRVGGTYWATQPALPPRYVLVCSAEAVNAAKSLGDSPVLLWERTGAGIVTTADQVATGDCDPWHMLGNAVAFVTDGDGAVEAIAAVLGVPAYEYDDAGQCLRGREADADGALAGALQQAGQLADPFTGAPMGARQAIELCGFWRRLIDSNRGIAGGVGFAFWKQANVASLLWDGSKPFAFLKAAPTDSRAPVAIWRSKTAPELLDEIAKAHIPLIEVEDGFLRSQGLGANCVPPLSLTVDRLGAYFDHNGLSELEALIEAGPFDPQIVERAGKLRQLIVEAGLGKYESGGEAFERPAGRRLHILVPGQVEDDRSVQTGGCGLSNLELLERVRNRGPDAFILYKPHPDVVAGHRKGAISEISALGFADQIVSTPPISSLIASVDEVHVNTSLTGFEALLREKSVTTYGVPFYAGWGLTSDLGPVPNRRTARRSLDEFVAATLLIYPRYLDPVTNLPCPAEIIVDRLSRGSASNAGLVVAARRLQGQLVRSFRRLVS